MEIENFTYSPKFCYNYFYDKAALLASDYEKQLTSMPIEYSECIPLDIASDWDYGAYHYILDKAIELKVFDDKIISLIKEISTCFIHVGYNGTTFDNYARDFKSLKHIFTSLINKINIYDFVWTLEALKNHPFWQEQRLRAKTLLNALDKIEIE